MYVQKINNAIYLNIISVENLTFVDYYNII